ncbi:nitrate- and nitrite sensing domain-containing protein, partial [Streptomyces sp. MBT53]|uniref:nitrate- and nitrite sensing domain-containing protein n=1 Tax=Streptomyces sp. MBT53 TaxID=1488384 RepID=UPI001F27E995
MRVLRAPARLRPRSVRAKIVALLMLPVVSLMALWGFAAVTTASSIADTETAKDVNSELLTPVAEFITAGQGGVLLGLQGGSESRDGGEEFGDTETAKDVNSELLTPVAEFITAVQGERTAALRHADAPAAFTSAARATDTAAAALRDGVNDSSSDAALIDSSLPGRIDKLEADATGLAALRASATAKGAKSTTTYASYSTIVEHGFSVTGALTGDKTAADASEARVVLELSRAREAVAQEQALLGADEQRVLLLGQFAPGAGGAEQCL